MKKIYAFLLRFDELSHIALKQVVRRDIKKKRHYRLEMQIMFLYNNLKIINVSCKMYCSEYSIIWSYYRRW